MSDTLTSSASMDSAVGSLKNQLTQAYSAVGIAPFMGESEYDGVIGALNQFEAKITDLDTRLRAMVLSGELPAEKWKAIAVETANGIQSVSGQKIGWEDFWNDVVVQSGTDLKQGWNDNAPYYITAALVGLALVLAIKLS